MFARLVQIYSHYVGVQRRYTYTNMAATELCKFVQNILIDICSLGKLTDLKLGEMSSLFTSYNMTIS